MSCGGPRCDLRPRSVFARLGVADVTCECGNDLMLRGPRIAGADFADSEDLDLWRSAPPEALEGPPICDPGMPRIAFATVSNQEGGMGGLVSSSASLCMSALEGAALLRPAVDVACCGVALLRGKLGAEAI